MRLVILVASILAFLSAPTIGQESQSQLTTEINTSLSDIIPGGINPSALRQALNDMTTAIFQIQHSQGSLVSVSTVPLSVVDLQTSVPVNGFYASGGGAVIQNCPLTGCVAGDHLQSALYLKATAVRDKSVAEYMATFDCNLNAGLTGTPAGAGNTFDAKVCLFSSTTTGSNSGRNSWGVLTDLNIGAGDTGLFKTATEIDITNSSSDCVAGTKSCFGLYLSGPVVNPITAFLNISVPTTASVASHFGIWISNVKMDYADFENDGSAPYGICNGCFSTSTHATASFRDNTTSPIGISLGGTYSAAAIQMSSGGKMCWESSNANCTQWDGTVINNTNTIGAPYIKLGNLAIGSLPTCDGTRLGWRTHVSNGVATPGLGTAVSATGAVFQPVLCTGSIWVYG